MQLPVSQVCILHSAVLLILTDCFFSGEGAFHSMMSDFGWAKNPMVRRIDRLREDVPITLLYGSRSWIDHSASDIIKDKRMNSFIKIHVSPS